jgi:PAS domain S-box-containing protein
VVSIAGAAAIVAICFAISLHYGIHIDAATPIVGIAAAYLVALVQMLDLQALDIFNQQIEAAQRRALMKTFVESSFDGIVITDEDGSISMINPAAAAMLACDADAVVGTSVEALLPHGAAADAVDPLHIGAQSKWDTQLGRSSGEPLDVEITLSVAEIAPTRHPLERRRRGRSVFIYVLHDITARKRVEESQRAASVAALANSRAKTEFLTNMSHELRTPLNAVIGFSEMIKGEVFGPVGQKRYVEYAQDIHDAGSHLLDIINDILSISRIELGQMHLSEGKIEIDRSIDSVIRLVALRAQAKAIALRVSVAPDLPLLMADERAVKQVLLNVLSNAIKFTDNEGSVEVRAQRDTSGGIAIVVADNGIGIAPEAIAKVAEPFFQADASIERRHDGVGLGLSIVRDLMALHGGSFAIASEPGAGTTVTLIFPPERVLDPVEIATPEAA